MALNFYLNNRVFNDSIDHYFESIYLKKVVVMLRELLSTETNFSFYFYLNRSASDLGNIKPFTGDENRKICIIVDEDLIEMPELLAEFDFVFQAYISDIKSSQRYFHFPLGYSRQLLEGFNRTILSRNTNVFFSGNLHQGRRFFYYGLASFKNVPFFIAHRLQRILKIKYDFLFKKSYIRFTNGFGKGLSATEYTEKLFDSKIVLCPPGISNSETYRLYEAMKAGCVIISEPLPAKPFYENMPIITIDSWANISNIIDQVLADEPQMLMRQKAVIAHWNERLSENATAYYIVDCILAPK